MSFDEKQQLDNDEIDLAHFKGFLSINIFCLSLLFCPFQSPFGWLPDPHTTVSVFKPSKNTPQRNSAMIAPKLDGFEFLTGSE